MSQTAISTKHQQDAGDTARVDMKLEVELIPVSDVDRAKEFYTRLGWRQMCQISPTEYRREFLTDSL